MMKNLLNLAIPSFVYYCNKPLSRSLPADLIKYDINEFCHFMSASRDVEAFTWCPSFLVPDSWCLTDNDKELLDLLKYRSISPEQLVICHMNNMVGSGVFTCDNIRKGSIIFYSGKITATSDNDLAYGMPLDDEFELDAAEVSSHASFFQDLWSPQSHEAKETLPHIAINNFIAKKIKFSFGTIIYLEAINDISANSQCGWKYGKNYWKAIFLNDKISKQYFSFSGEMVQEKEALQLRQYEEIEFTKNYKSNPKTLFSNDDRQNADINLQDNAHTNVTKSL